MSAYSESDYRRLLWHCRRGMLELDVLLVPFIEDQFRSLNDADQARFEKLLAAEDQDMFAWFMGHAAPEDEDIRRIVTLILERVQPRQS